MNPLLEFQLSLHSNSEGGLAREDEKSIFRGRLQSVSSSADFFLQSAEAQLFFSQHCTAFFERTTLTKTGFSLQDEGRKSSFLKNGVWIRAL